MSDMIKGTMISYRPDIKVLDATIRDGGLVNNFEFTDDFVRKLYLTNLRAGVDIMEIGYLADPELFEESKFGKWKFCHEDAIRKVLGDILDPKMQLAVMADVGRANVARDLPDKKDSILDVVRIANLHQHHPGSHRDDRDLCEEGLSHHSEHYGGFQGAGV